MKHLRVDVCVLGASPAGLALVGLLARSGIDTLAVTRKAGLHDAPHRQRNYQHIDADAMRVLRDQGLQSRLERMAGSRPVEGGSAAFNSLLLSAVQLDEAQRLGADVRFGLELLEVRQDVQAAYAHLRDLNADQDYEVIADYLVGTDEAWQFPDRRQGRVLSPESGLGAAYALAWRLAYVVKGQADACVLDSGGTSPVATGSDECVPVVPLRQGRTQILSLDLVGKGEFTLLTGPHGASWRLAANTQAGALGIAIKVVGIGPNQEAEDVSGAWVAQCGIAADGCLLVRPDGRIALRVESHHPDAEEVLGASLRRHLGLSH